MSWFVGVHVCLQIFGEGGVARDRVSLHPEAEITENRISYREGIREPSTRLEFGGFDGMLTGGE